MQSSTKSINTNTNVKEMKRDWWKISSAMKRRSDRIPEIIKSEIYDDLDPFISRVVPDGPGAKRKSNKDKEYSPTHEMTCTLEVPNDVTNVSGQYPLRLGATNKVLFCTSKLKIL